MSSETSIEQLSLPTHAYKIKAILLISHENEYIYIYIKDSIETYKEKQVTFWMMDNASLASQLPLWNDPQVPCGLPKLANLIDEIGRPWHDNSNVFLS